MDDRKLRAKELKRTYQKERRRMTRVWDIFSWLLGPGASACLCAGAYVHLACVNQLVSPLWQQAKAATGLETGFLWQLAKDWALPAACGLLALWILCRTLSLCAAGRAKKCDAYLSLQTLRRTLKAEKEEASV